jgi:hypothetical protein
VHFNDYSCSPHHLFRCTCDCRIVGTLEENLAKKKIVDTYHQQLQKIHNAHTGDLMKKIRLKWYAVDALPTEELREEALVIETRIFPAYRRIATWTPPTIDVDAEYKAARAEAKVPPNSWMSYPRQ